MKPEEQERAWEKKIEEQALQERRELFALKIYSDLMHNERVYALPLTIEQDAVCRADRLIRELDKEKP